MIEFWTSLIKTPEKNDFLTDNCTHVIGEYWIYEGVIESLEDAVTSYEVVSEGAVPCLGGLSRQELVNGCIEWYAVEPHA